jgi:hypothetical protein
MKIPKVKKAKIPTKICFLCGEDTSDYIIYQNGAVCEVCQEGNKFKEMKDEHNC